MPSARKAWDPRKPPKPIKDSPWGPVQHERVIAPGISSVSTASHGGIKLSPARNSQIPELVRNAGGWYEEDVDWAVVPLVYPEVFSGSEYSSALQTIKNWKPVFYEMFFGVKLQPGDSFVRDEQVFRHRHRNDYIAMAAWGDWHDAVPPGSVAVFAGRGGRTPTGSYPSDTAWFLVPEPEYDAAGPHGFVVDERRHPRIDPIQ